MKTHAEPALINEVAQRFDAVSQQIREAAEQAGRSASEIQLIAVSKRQPVESIRAAYACGLRVFGENYAEEALEKMDQLSDLPGICWEMIGHVQSRKARLVANNFARVHSLDSLKLARLLNQNRVDEKPLEVLLEVNVSGEGTKEGVAGWQEDQWPELLPLVEEITGFERLNLAGLMTMPPLFENASRSSPYFARLRRLREYLNAKIPRLKLVELSMGTSSDYKVAIVEGATIIRVGTDLLGERNYSR